MCIRDRIKRAGDVIPKIVKVFPAKSRQHKITPPETCPCKLGMPIQQSVSLVWEIYDQEQQKRIKTFLSKYEANEFLDKNKGSSLEIIEKSEPLSSYKCTGDRNCPERLRGKLIHFVSRRAFDIEGMGNEIVKLFIEKGLLKNFTDIFNLSSHSETIMEFDGFGTKSCHKLIQAIEVAKNISFERLLYALGIDEVGEATSKALARAFEYPEALVSASFKSLIEIEDIGPKVASNILDYFADDFQLNEFLNLGSILNITFPKSVTNNALSGQIFVITGSFESYGRDEIKSLLE